jgi:CubicO group peptidase (beta-lactamase class C family)
MSKLVSIGFSSVSVLFLGASLCFSEAPDASIAPIAAEQNRRERVEQGLIPYAPVTGFPKWSIKDRMSHYGVAGASITVIHDFKIDWTQGYGISDVNSMDRVTDVTMFNAGSISKLAMACIAIKLAENGTVDLDRPINQYLRSWTLDENEFTKQVPVTLRMLLSHTARTSQYSYYGFEPNLDSYPTIPHILSGIEGTENQKVVVTGVPDKSFQYSGGGSLIAQLAMMDATGESMESLALSSLFRPLSMANSTFEQPVPERFHKQLSWGYSKAAWYRGKPKVYPQQAAAGLTTTSSDLAKMMVELQLALAGRSRWLRQDSAKAMLTPVTQMSFGLYREEMALGPIIKQLHNNQTDQGKYIMFDGVNAGFLAYAIANQVDGNGVVVMLNSGDNQTGLGPEIIRAVAEVYGWKHYLPEPIQPIELTAAELDAYVGSYANGDQKFTITREGKYLACSFDGASKSYCFPVARDQVIFDFVRLECAVERSSDGKVQAFSSQWVPHPYRRVAN